MAAFVVTSVGDFGAGTLREAILVVRPTTTGAISNTALVTALEPDQIPSKNSSTLTTTVIAAPPATDGPRIVGLPRLGYHNLPTSLVLTLNMPLDPARAQDVHNHVLMAAAEDRRLTFRPTHRIAILSAVYDPIVKTVTLRPASRLDLRRAYHRTVSGVFRTGLRDVHGVPLDGAGTGRGGSDDAATILGFNVIAIGDPPARPKVAPHHHATRHAAAPLPRGATLFGHPDILASRRNPR